MISVFVFRLHTSFGPMARVTVEALHVAIVLSLLT